MSENPALKSPKRPRKTKSSPPDQSEVVWLPFKSGREKPRAPSERNREIFDEIRLCNLSIRAAAARYELSTTRITQILTQVQRWIAATNGEGASRQTTTERLAVAEYVHRGRLEHMYSRAMTMAGQTFEGLPTHKVTILPDKRETRQVSISRAGSSQLMKTALIVQKEIFELAVRMTQLRPKEMHDEQRRAEIKEAVGDLKPRTKKANQGAVVEPPVDAGEKKASAECEVPSADDAVVAEPDSSLVTPSPAAESIAAEPPPVTESPTVAQPAAPQPKPPMPKWMRDRLPTMTRTKGPPDRLPRVTVTRIDPVPPRLQVPAPIPPKDNPKVRFVRGTLTD